MVDLNWKVGCQSGNSLYNTFSMINSMKTLDVKVVMLSENDIWDVTDSWETFQWAFYVLRIHSLVSTPKAARLNTFYKIPTLWTTLYWFVIIHEGLVAEAQLFLYVSIHPVHHLAVHSTLILFPKLFSFQMAAPQIFQHLWSRLSHSRLETTTRVCLTTRR